jgi:integrase
MRIGELCAIKWSDIDLKNRTLTINKTIQRIYLSENSMRYTKVLIGSPKTQSSNRTLPLSSTIVPLLQKLVQSPETYLLSATRKPIEPRNLRACYERLLRQLDINFVNFHSLRHTFATRLIEAGIDPKTVSSLLGHSSVSTTLNLYVHPQMEQKRLAVEVLNELF